MEKEISIALVAYVLAVKNHRRPLGRYGHNCFAECEKKFGIGRMKPQPQQQKTARSGLLRSDDNYSGSVTGSVIQPVCDGELRTVSTDDIEQPTDVATEGFNSLYFSGADLEDESTSQPGVRASWTKDRNREFWVGLLIFPYLLANFIENPPVSGIRRRRVGINLM